MVDAGVHDFKPYVHSDCGGDYRPKQGGDLLRWTAHCVFGTSKNACALMCPVCLL